MLSGDLEGWDGVWVGVRLEGRGYMYTCSLCYIAEDIITL